MSSGHRSEPSDVIPDGLYMQTQGLVSVVTVDRQYDVKTLANRSKNGKKVYIDRDVPTILPKTNIDTGKTLPWHEISEWLLMNRGKSYDDGPDSAHPIATAVEKKRVEALGGDWKEYTDEMDGLISSIAHKTISNPPPDQDERVFQSWRNWPMADPIDDVIAVEITDKDGRSWFSMRSDLDPNDPDNDGDNDTNGGDTDDDMDPNRTTPGMSAEIMVYDEIGAYGINAASFDKALKALGDVKHITMRVNSPGGDSFSGIAIHNTLQKHPAKITARVDGIAASAASLITMAADKIVMPENSFMVVHEPHALTIGPASAHRAMADDLERVSNSYANVYSARSKQPVENVKTLMAEDRLMGAQECKDKGYCDKMIPAADMRATFALEKLPPKHRDLAASIFKPEDVMTDKSSSEGEMKMTQSTQNTPVAEVVEQAPIVVAASVSYGQSEIEQTIELCTIAGVQLAQANAFVAAKTPVAKVREALINAQAKAAESRSITPHVTSDGGGSSGGDSSEEILARKREMQKQLRAEMGLGRRAA